MILFVDTATTGRYHYREPDDAAIQPHLCRLSALLVDGDAEQSDYCRLVAPREGWMFETDAVVAHGIHPSMARADGHALKQVLGHFLQMKASSSLIVAYNWDHHRRQLCRAAADCGIEIDFPEAFCAMRAATDHVRMPRMGGGYRWPRMPDAYSYFTNGEEMPKEADPVEQGLNLVRCLRRIYEGIVRERT